MADLFGIDIESANIVLNEDQEGTTAYEAATRSKEPPLSTGNYTAEQAARLAVLDEDEKMELRYREMIEAAEDPDAERAKIQSSRIMSEVSGDSRDMIYNNYDSYMTDYFGVTSTPQSNLQAISAAYQSGKIDLDVGLIAWEQMNSYAQTGSEDETLAAQIQALEDSRPPEDQVHRGFGIRMAKFTAGLIPIMKHGIGEGIKKGVAGAGVMGTYGSVVPGVGTAAGLATGYLWGQTVGAAADIGKIEAGLAWLEMGKIENELGEKIDPEVKFWASLAIGGGNMAVEMSQMGRVLDLLGIDNALGAGIRNATKRGFQRAFKSEAYAKAVESIGGKIVTGTLANTGEEVIQQFNNILWREAAIEITNSQVGTHLDHPELSALMTELKDTAVQAGMGMMGISLITGGLGAPVHMIRASNQTAKVKKLGDTLTDMGYDIPSAEGETLEAQVAGTLNKAQEDFAGKTNSNVLVETDSVSVDGQDGTKISGTLPSGASAGSLTYTVDEEGVAHITDAEFSGRSLEAREVYAELEGKYGENIQWDLPEGGRGAHLKDVFSSKDFTADIGSDTTFTQGSVADRQTFQDNLSRAFPEFKEGELGAAMDIVDQRAAAAGMTTDEFVKKYIHEDAFVAGLDMKHLKDGKLSNVRGAHTILAEGKAVFYFGKGANLETWTHEFGHLIRSTLSESELAGIQEALGVEAWDEKAEEHFTDVLLNYLKTGEAPENMTGPLSKIKTYLAELWSMAKMIAGNEEISAETKTAYDNLFMKKESTGEAAQPAEGTLHERTMILSPDKTLSRKETSLGYGVRTHTGPAGAIAKYRSAQIRKGVQLTKDGEIVRGKGETQRNIFRNHAQDLLDLQDGKISELEFRNKLTKTYMRLNSALEEIEAGPTKVNTADVRASIEAFKEEIMALGDDLESLGARIPQLGHLASAEVKDGSFLTFNQRVSPAARTQLRKLSSWMTENNPLDGVIRTVKLETGEYRTGQHWDAALEAIETGTGADVYDALIYATGSSLLATNVLADLGFVGARNMDGVMIQDQVVFMPADISILGNWTSLEKLDLAVFSGTVAEKNAIKTLKDPGMREPGRMHQIENGHDNLIKNAGLWDNNINEYFNQMERLQVLHEDLYKWLKVDRKHKGVQVPNIQEMQHYLDNNPSSLATLQDVSEIMGSKIFEDDGKTLMVTAIENRMITRDRSKTGEPVQTQKFFNFGRTFHQLIWDSMDNERREGIRGTYIKAMEIAYKDPSKRTGTTKQFWDHTADKSGSMNSTKQMFSAIKKAEKTFGAINLSTMCPMYQVGANGCYMDACYVTAMAAGALRQNLYSTAMYVADILQLSDDEVAFFNTMGGLRINGAGDIHAQLKPILQDIFRHAAWKGLELKVITKQEETLRIVSELQNSPDKDVAKTAKDIVVQTTVDPYWVPVETDLTPGSAVDIYGVGTLLDRFNTTKDPEVKESALEAIKMTYETFGQACEVKDGVIARKYGFSSDQIIDMAQKYPTVNVLLRNVVGTPKEIAEFALHAPNILQTWMHAKIEDSMFSEVEGRWLANGEIGNFKLGNRIVTGEDGLLHVEGVDKRTDTIQKGKAADAYKSLDEYLHNTYNGMTTRFKDGVITEMPTHQAILGVLQGHQGVSPSALCCTFTANPNECGDCTSLCHDRSSFQGSSLEAIAQNGREHRLFQAEDYAVPGDGAFSEWYDGPAEENGDPVVFWGDDKGRNLHEIPRYRDLPYYVSDKKGITHGLEVRRETPGRIARALRGAYAAGNYNPNIPPGWTQERADAASVPATIHKTGWGEQVQWIEDQIKALGYEVEQRPLNDGSVAYELTGPSDLFIRMGAGEYSQVNIAEDRMDQPLPGDFDIEFTPPGGGDLVASPDWIGTLRGLGRLSGVEAVQAELALDRREYGIWKRATGTLYQADVYHGAAKLFEQFDHSWMGSGEGHQAYGWGTYLTSLADIAKGYAERSAANNQVGNDDGDFTLRDADAPEILSFNNATTGLLMSNDAQTLYNVERSSMKNDQSQLDHEKGMIPYYDDLSSNLNATKARLEEAVKTRTLTEAEQFTYDHLEQEIEDVEREIRMMKSAIESYADRVARSKEIVDYLETKKGPDGIVQDNWYSVYRPGFHFTRSEALSWDDQLKTEKYLNKNYLLREAYFEGGREGFRKQLEKVLRSANEDLSDIKEDLVSPAALESGRMMDRFKAKESQLINEVALVENIITAFEDEAFKVSYDGPTRVVYDVTVWEGKEENLLSWESPVQREMYEKVYSGIQEIYKRTKKGSYVRGVVAEVIEGMQEGITGEIQMTGEDLYNALVKLPLGDNFKALSKTTNEDEYYGAEEVVRPDKAASLWLLDLGVDGITMPTGFLGGGPTQSNRNYVVFDDKAIRINSSRLFQEEPLTIDVQGIGENPLEKNLRTAEDIALNNTKVELKNFFWDNDYLNDDLLYAMRGDTIKDMDESMIEEALSALGDKRDLSEVYDENFDEDAGLSDAEEFEATSNIMDWAKASKGTTEDLNEAGYVLPDGTLLDFSGKRNGGEPGTRAEDHRQLNIPISGEQSGTDLMIGFMDAGAVRIDAVSGLVDVSREPSPAQYDVIKKIVENGNAFVDAKDGERLWSFEADDAKKTIGFLKRFYSGENRDPGALLFEEGTANALPAAVNLSAMELEELARGYESWEEFRDFFSEEDNAEEFEDSWFEEFWGEATDIATEKQTSDSKDAEFLGEIQSDESLTGFLSALGDSLAELSKQDHFMYMAAKRAQRGEKFSEGYKKRVREAVASDLTFWRKANDRVTSDNAQTGPLNMTNMEDRLSIARSLEDPAERLAFWSGEMSFETAVMAHDQAIQHLEELTVKMAKGEAVAKETLVAAKKAINDKYKQRAYMDKLAKRITRPPAKSANWRYREAIEQIQARFDPKRRSKGTLEARAMISDLQDELGDHITGDTRRSLNQFTVEELEQLANEVTALRKEGRRIYIAQQENKVERRKTMRASLMDSLLNGDPLQVEEFFGSEEKIAADKKGKFGRNIRADWDRPNRIFRYFDGDKDNGSWHSRVWRKINELTDSEIRNIDRRWGSVDSRREELGLKVNDFYKKKFTHEGVTYTLNDVLMFYGASQNARAKKAVVFGVLTKDDQKSGEAIMNALIDQLSAEEKAFVDSVIDQFDAGDWDRVRNVANDLDNINPGKEERYLPLYRLDNHGQTLQEEIVGEIKTRLGLGKTTPKKGMTIERQTIKDLRQKPIRTDFLEVVRRGIEMQEHYIHFSSFTRDMLAMLGNDDFRTALKQRLGQEGVRWLETYVNQVADPNAMKEQDSLGKLATMASNGMGVAYLAYSMSTIVKQVSALPLYAGYASPARIAASSAKFAVAPGRMWKEVSEKDPQLKHRIIDQLLERFKVAASVHKAGALGEVKRVRDAINSTGFKGIEYVDKAVAAIGWDACYQQALSEGKSEAEAVAYAQDVMLITQSAARAKDLPQAYRTGGDVKKIFLVFSNQIHQMYQMIFRDLPAAAKNRQLLFMVSSAVGLAISMGFEGAIGDREWPEDPEDVPRWLLYGTLEKIPLIGKQVSSGLRGWSNSGADLFKIAQESALAVNKIAKAIENDDYEDLPLDVWKTIDEGMAIAFRFPYSGPKKLANAIRQKDPMELVGRKREE